MHSTRASIGRSSLSPARHLLALAGLALLALIAVGPARRERERQLRSQGPVAVQQPRHGHAARRGARRAVGTGRHLDAVGRRKDRLDAHQQQRQLQLQSARRRQLRPLHAGRAQRRSGRQPRRVVLLQRLEHAKPRPTTSHAGVVNLGTYEISKEGGNGTPKCAVWQGAHNAYQNYKQVTGKRAAGQGSTRSTRTSPAAACRSRRSTRRTGPGTSRPDTTAIRTGATRPTSTSSPIRSGTSFDGSFAHFLYDAARFGYIKNHELCLVSNEGFAFNEGWAEFWAHTPATCGDGTNFSQEGNVASRSDRASKAARIARRWSTC